MKISELSNQTICSHCGVYEPDAADVELIEVYKAAASSQLAHFTGIPADELDNYEDLTVAYLCVISDMYENRSTAVNKESLNPTVQTIISLHDRNLIA